MLISKEKKKTVIAEFRAHPADAGSSAVQVALLTERIQILSEHMKKCPKDFSSRKGLLQMVNRRRRLLSYLKEQDPDHYQKLIQRLELRK